MEPTTFGALLKRYRMAAGLTQEALAERANLSTRAISDLEQGLSRMPRYDTLDLLARAMNLEASQRSALFAAARPARRFCRWPGVDRPDSPARSLARSPDHSAAAGTA
jgi:transcriptional regulator with XRE-family HTH domain